MTDRELRQRELVAKLVDLATLEEQPHWNTAHPEFKSYRVQLRGRVIGTVERTTEVTFRKAGRLRYGEREMRSPRWRYEAPGLNSARLRYGSRKQAVEELIYHLVIHGKIRR